MVLTLEALISFDRVLELELDFGVIRRKLKADLVDQLRCEREMSPTLKVLVALVLQTELPTLVELNHVSTNFRWRRFVHSVIEHLAMNVIRHDREGFGHWWCRYLPHEVVSKCVLNAGVFKEYGFRPDVEHSVVALNCYESQKK